MGRCDGNNYLCALMSAESRESANRIPKVQLLDIPSL